jgi:hypothetical protein
LIRVRRKSGKSPPGFAWASIEVARADHQRGHQESGEEQEIRALARSGREAGLMLEAGEVLPSLKIRLLSGGVEHRVAVLREDGLVFKEYDTRLFNEDGYPLYKPTECLFDCLTDHLLANHLFGDEIRLWGFRKGPVPGGDLLA